MKVHVRANGIVRGDHIDLEQPISEFPDGSPVSIVLSPRAVSPDEKHRLIDELCGAWSDDPSLVPIFDQILVQRRQSQGRTIDLDDPS